MRTYLFGHTSPKTAYEVKNYPYGRLRTSQFYYIESTPKKGDRLVTWTINPKNGRVNAEKKSTYSAFLVLYINSENGHIETTGMSQFDTAEKIKAFVETIGGEEKLNDIQRMMYRQITGTLKRAVISGADFKIKWEKNHMGTAYHELKITFDRPDGIALKEIFQAMKSVNQDKLKEVFAGYESKNFGHVKGIVRICVRGGMQITSVGESVYNEWLASDFAANETEKETEGAEA